MKLIKKIRLKEKHIGAVGPAKMSPNKLHGIMARTIDGGDNGVIALHHSNM